MESCVIEVAPKSSKGVRALAEEAKHLGVKSVQAVETAQLYRLAGKISEADSQRIGRDLLCDPVTEDWRLEGKSRTPAAKGQAAWVVDVWYKPGVTDVVGESVAKGIRDLGIATVTSVRTGARYRVRGTAPKDSAERLARALFANILVQDYSIHADA